MAAQKVGFTPRLLRQVALNSRFKLNCFEISMYIRAELETC
jgi:hypothetical protein